MTYQQRRTGPKTTVVYNRPSIMAHRPPVRPVLNPTRIVRGRGLGALGDTSPLLFNLGTFPVTVDTASYALLGLAAILLVPVLVGPQSAKGRRKRIYSAARAPRSGSLLDILPWAVILGGGAYWLGQNQGGL
jgi:hypothetical protein